MSLDKEAIETLGKVMINSINVISKNLPFDKTIEAVVSQKIDTNNYYIIYNNNKYKAYLKSGISLPVGSNVDVLVPLNDWNRLIILN